MGTLTELHSWIAAKYGEEGPPVVKNELDMEASVAPIRKIQPGDLLDVVRKLRTLMAQYQTCGFSLYANFEELGDRELEAEAEKARHTLELAASRVASLLSKIETTPYFEELRARTLKLREDNKHGK